MGDSCCYCWVSVIRTLSKTEINVGLLLWISVIESAYESMNRTSNSSSIFENFPHTQTHEYLFCIIQQWICAQVHLLSCFYTEFEIIFTPVTFKLNVPNSDAYKLQIVMMYMKILTAIPNDQEWRKKQKKTKYI